MNARTSSTCLVLIVLVGSFALADHSRREGCTDTIVLPWYGDEDASSPVYVVIDTFGTGSFTGDPWIYAEWNGEDGLQRHDDYCRTPGYGTPESPADLLVF